MRHPSGLPSRRQHLPWHYCDDPPPLPIPVLTSTVVKSPGEKPYANDVSAGPLDIEIDIDPIPGSPALSNDAINYVHTNSDGNDLFHQYLGCFPSHDPEKFTSLSRLCDGPTFQCEEADEEIQLPALPLTSLRKNYFEPFLNATVW